MFILYSQCPSWIQVSTLISSIQNIYNVFPYVVGNLEFPIFSHYCKSYIYPILHFASLMPLYRLVKNNVLYFSSKFWISYILWNKSGDSHLSQVSKRRVNSAKYGVNVCLLYTLPPKLAIQIKWSILDKSNVRVL